ncbi:AMIN-like domain-containing (lipo)protein [Brachybacterium sp. AOP24-D1-21]|uniref:AMIN-like domain-containing (lipo)protein n=1 Tax=Brachybacterium sp. AOP24-D1-21 TaxID=3457711 RepID=UPI0040333D1F
MKKRVLSVLATCALLLGLGMFAPATATAAPYCGLTWGSLPESATGMSSAQIKNLRSGRHSCFDRLVVDLQGDVSGYTVQYVSRVSQLGSGFTVPLSGAADLEILINAPAHDGDYRATFSPRHRTQAVNVDGYRTFRQVAFSGSFEGQTLIGLGVRARLPMRTFVLDGPGDGSRLVIDVAHRW